MLDQLLSRWGRGRTADAADDLACGLGWFSIGLGLAEFLAPAAIGRTAQLEQRTTLLRTYGLRELVAGLGILISTDRTPWLYARLLGDALDLATLLGGRQGRRGSPVLALLAVAGVTALDCVCARALDRSASAAKP